MAREHYSSAHIAGYGRRTNGAIVFPFTGRLRAYAEAGSGQLLAMRVGYPKEVPRCAVFLRQLSLFGGLLTACTASNTTSTEVVVSNGDTNPVAQSEFDFSTDELCDWFSPEEFTSMVAEVYSTHGIAPISKTAGLDCNPRTSDSDSYTDLEILTPHDERARAISDPDEE